MDATVTPVAKSVAVVMFNFSDLRTTPFTKAQVQDALTTGSGSVKAFYEEESKGGLTISGSVFGWYQIAATTANCDWSTWHTQAWNAATAAGVNLSAYTNVMFVFPNTSACGWAGLGYVPGPYTYINGTLSVQVMTHELGHNFGLAHANAANCVVNGTRVMIAATSSCTTVGYADPFSTMGNNALRHNHASHLGELGWLSASEKVVGVPGNTYTITPYFGPAGVKLVRVPRGDGSFFDLDIRMTYGVFDTFTSGAAATTGVTIRLGYGTASPTTNPQATLLLDSTPGTSDLKDAPLAVGRTMTDPVSKISITAMSVSSAGIVVRVREGIAPGAVASPSATPADGSVTLTWGAATDNVAVADYRISRDGAPPDDRRRERDLVRRLDGRRRHHLHVHDRRARTRRPTSDRPRPSRSPPRATRPARRPRPTPRRPRTRRRPRPDARPGPDPAADLRHRRPDRTRRGRGQSRRPRPSASPGTPRPTTPASSAYRVTRNGTLVASPTGLAWKDTARKPLTTYTYTVAALDAVGNVSSSASVTVRTLADTIAAVAAGQLPPGVEGGRVRGVRLGAVGRQRGGRQVLPVPRGRAAPLAIAKDLADPHLDHARRPVLRAGDRLAGNRSWVSNTALGRR